LKAPSKDFNNIINKALNNDFVINKWIDDESITCKGHKIFILEKLLIFKMFKTAKSFSTTSTQTKIAKLKFLNHI